MSDDRLKSQHSQRWIPYRERWQKWRRRACQNWKKETYSPLRPMSYIHDCQLRAHDSASMILLFLWLSLVLYRVQRHLILNIRVVTSWTRPNRSHPKPTLCENSVCVHVFDKFGAVTIVAIGNWKTYHVRLQSWRSDGSFNQVWLTTTYRTRTTVLCFLLTRVCWYFAFSVRSFNIHW